MKNFLIMILLIISTTSNAQDAVLIEKDSPAPFSGVLLTKERAEKAVKAEKSNLLLKDLSLHKDSLIKYYKEDASLQRKRLSSEKFKNNIYNVGYFLLGVVITSYAFKIQQEISK